MLAIRLTRKGRKNQPFFRVVVVDKRRSSKGGRSIDEVGHIDPLTKRKSFDKAKILQWIKNGAQPSDTVRNLLISEKIIEGAKVKKFSQTKKAKAEAATASKAEADKKAAEAAAAAAPAPEAPAPAGEATPAPEPPKEEKPAEAPVEAPKEEPKA